MSDKDGRPPRDVVEVIEVALAPTDMTLEVLKEIRNTLRDHGRLLTSMSELVGHHSKVFNRIDTRLASIDTRLGDIEERMVTQTNELEVIIRGEMLGHRTHFEVQWENKLVSLDERIKELEDQLSK